ncbi:hypothetical protein [Staphylococcus delphini]|uniref:hypothetical protein n=1 Tax=Staphylococcus delphini TaxID=53344 RepID=UPI001570B9FD|nr:hypothetical protein [Staphylococcus delphini]UXS21174.1 hypothetical protein MUA22_10115 [Staphylococcus delphini]
MASFKVIKSCRDKKTNKHYEKDQKITATLKEVNDFEKRLEKAGYELPFFKRLDK